MFGTRHLFLALSSFFVCSLSHQIYAQSKGDSLASLADDYFNNRLYEDAIKFEKQSLQWFVAKGRVEKQSNNLNNIGLYFFLLGKYDSSLFYYNESLQIDLTLANPRRVITRYKNLGITHKKMGNYGKALDFYLKALQLSNESDESSKLGAIYLSIANLLLQQSRPEEATNYLNKASKEFLAQNDSSGYIKSINNLGSAYFRIPNYDSALYFYQAALNLKRIISSKEFLGPSLQNVGETYFALNQLDSAEFYLLEALKSKEKEGNIQSISLTALNLVKVLLSKDDIQKADQYLTLVDTYLNEITSADIQVLYYFNRHQYYEKVNDKASSLVFYKKWNNLQDSLFQAEKITVLDRLNAYEKNELRTEKERAEEQSRLQQKINDQQQVIISAIGLILLVTILLVVIVLRSRRRERQQNKLLETKNVAIQGLNDKLATLVDDIKHRKQNDYNRLIGTIEQISAKHENLSEILSPLYSLIFANADIDDYLDNSSTKEQVDLHFFLTDLTEKLNEFHDFTNKDIRFEVEIPSINTSARVSSTLAFIICELVNNSMKYGISSRHQPVLRLAMSAIGEKVNFTYSDNGDEEQYVEKFQAGSNRGKSILNRFLASLNSKPELTRQNDLSVFRFSFKLDQP